MEKRFVVDRTFPPEVVQTGENTAVVRDGMVLHGYASLRVTQSPTTAWMTYRGFLEPMADETKGIISPWAAKNLVGISTDREHYLLLRSLEDRIERRRQQFSTDIQSRLKNYFVFSSENDAHMASARWGWPEKFVSGVSILPGSRVSIHDATWIEYFNSAGEVPSEDIDCYLHGCAAPGREPIWEMLVAGRAYIESVDIRQGALNVLETAWPPEYLDLLEFCRIAALLGSHAGSIGQFIRAEKSKLIISSAIDMEDFNNHEFMRRFWDFAISQPPSEIDWQRINSFQKKEEFFVPKIPDLHIPYTLNN